ncbi:putative bifunctional diguanylate cyclase/phosphodiesterase [Nocardia brasiliensis]|nr:bifunctional diguanylate cyclase/phosphodiesterase [Nocardia brasiliensis]
MTSSPLTSEFMAGDSHDAAPKSSTHVQLAIRWSAALDTMDRPRTTALIRALAHEVHHASTTECIVAAGARLAEADDSDGETLGRSLAVLHAHFTCADLARTKPSATQILTAFTYGYEHALRTQLRSAQNLARSAKTAARIVAEQRSHGDCADRARGYDPDSDALTGLPNRSRFFEDVAVVLSANDAQIGVCYVDLDLFGTVNATWGFRAGDEILAQTAARIRDCVPEPDRVVARMGSDEFAVLVPRCGDAAEMVALARTVLDTVARTFEIGGRCLRITASAGVTVTGTQRSGSDLVRAAELAARWAKAVGPNTFRVFDTGRERNERARAELLADLPQALAENQFFLDYQPIIGLADKSIVAIEALVRWRHPAYGTLAPARFIDLAEDNGHITELGTTVLTRVCQDIQNWHRLGNTPTVNVNISAAEVADPNWLERVCNTIAEARIEPSLLQLELTERTAIDATGRPTKTLQNLAARGVRIAIDDFGTGYSSLALLGKLPLHAVKLAGQFVRRIRTPDTTSRSDLLVLQAIIDLTHALDSTATAECVETRHQAEQLRAMGCDSAQGWYFHRPVSPSAITSLLVAS